MHGKATSLHIFMHSHGSAKCTRSWPKNARIEVTEFQSTSRNNVRREMNASKREQFINKRKISSETKIKVSRVIYSPVLTYVCERKISV